MKLDTDNIEIIKEALNNMLEDTEKVTTSKITSILNTELTQEEKKLFNEGEFAEVLPIIYALEIADQSGCLCLVSTKENIAVLVNDYDCTGADDPELIQYHEQLQRVWSTIF